MIRFYYIIWIGYFVLAVASYPFIRNNYFPNAPTTLEKAVSWILAFAWLVTVPITFVLKQNDDEVESFETSYEGFVGSEA